MSKPLDVYAIGSTVLLDGTISARIAAVFIRGNNVAYEVVWWNERDRQEEIVADWELRPDNKKARKLRINPVL